jgi:hypothetical protein
MNSDGTYNTSVQDPMVAAFGFGRRCALPAHGATRATDSHVAGIVLLKRICPGRHVAINGAYITAASILACFNITPDPEQVTGIVDNPRVPIMTSGHIS